jgi:hypothetical protein
MEATLSATEHAQLRVLYEVYKRPTQTGIWRGTDCDRLVDLGLAERSSISGIAIVSISPAGIERREADDA